ncbi:hypothetical protein CLU79DRAFT_712515, partial [Phycomyces nitens]
LIDIDLCRIGELYKRQIQLRMKKAKFVKEFKSFGHSMTFYTLDLDLAGDYNLYEYQSVPIPTFSSQ